MFEQAITISVIAGSILLLSYWSRYLLRLISDSLRKLHAPQPGVANNLDALKQLLDLDNSALDRITKRRGER
jgi:hypothetical protein